MSHVLHQRVTSQSVLRSLLGGWVRRFVSLLAAGMILAVTPGFLPLVVAGIAALDGDHRVMLRGSGEDADIVLHHDGSIACSAAHQHCAVSRVLVFFSHSSSTDPDHVLHFTAGCKFVRENPLVLSTPDAEAPAPVLIISENQFPPITFTATLEINSSPPAPPGALASVRTTVLLI